MYIIDEIYTSCSATAIDSLAGPVDLQIGDKSVSSILKYKKNN